MVQVKRRSNIEKNESVDVVRQLNGVVFRENASKGVVVTTAKSFTLDAQREAIIATDSGERRSIELFGFENVVEWLNLPEVASYEPWQQVTKEKFEIPAF